MIIITFIINLIINPLKLIITMINLFNKIFYIRQIMMN